MPSKVNYTKYPSSILRLIEQLDENEVPTEPAIVVSGYYFADMVGLSQTACGDIRIRLDCVPAVIKALRDCAQWMEEKNDA